MHEYDDHKRLEMRLVSQGSIDEDIDPRVEEEITGSTSKVIRRAPSEPKGTDESLEGGIHFTTDAEEGTPNVYGGEFGCVCLDT